MRSRTLSLINGPVIVLMTASRACGGFVGLDVVSKPNPFGLLVCNVFAVFDRPGQDFFLAVSGKPQGPISIDVVGGTFYQHPQGGDTAPLAALVDLFPSLAYDSFVTIGVKSVGLGGQPEDHLTLSPGWLGFGPSTLPPSPGANAGWAVTPGQPQADPFNPSFFAGDGHVLIGQFSTANGTAISGMMQLLVISNGVLLSQLVNFIHVPSPGGLPLLMAASLLARRRRRLPQPAFAHETR
jgi:hypothetical protein